MAAKIEQVLTDDIFRQKLERHGLEKSKEFTWDATAKRALVALEIYHETLGTSKEIDTEQRNQDAILSRLIESIADISAPFEDHDLLNAAQAIAQNHRTQKQRQLLVDVSVLSKNDFGTGVQRVTRSILSTLLKDPPEGWDVQLVSADNESPFHYRYARQFTQKIFGSVSDVLPDERVEFISGDIFLGLDLMFSYFAQSNRGFYQRLRNHGVKVKFVVYDLLPIRFPDYFPHGSAEGHDHWMEIVAQSDGAICISKAVAADVDEWIKEHPQGPRRAFDISWFHLGADIESHVASLGMPDDSKDVLEEIKKRPSFLTVSTVEPRKKHDQVLDAFEKLWAQGREVNLVIVGRQGWRVDRFCKRLLQHSEFGKRLFWLDGISDEYLEKVYAASKCLIFASIGEGFGLPLVEAAQHKLTIIARDIPVFHEVAGEHAYYFKNDLNPDTIASTVLDWLKLYEVNNHPKSDDMPILTWSQSTLQLLKAVGIEGFA